MGGAADLDLLYHLATFVRATRVVETGVAYGWSSLALLQAMSNNPSARLVSIDLPYLNRGNDRYVGCAVPSHLRSGWKLIRTSDRMSLEKALGELRAIDLCHYDSDKSWFGRMWAYPRLWNALRSAGIFISDDVGDNFAFRLFCEQVGRQPIIVRHNNRFVGLLIKP
jgi:predicted O-methyltransferase YrrM